MVGGGFPHHSRPTRFKGQQGDLAALGPLFFVSGLLPCVAFCAPSALCLVHVQLVRFDQARRHSQALATIGCRSPRVGRRRCCTAQARCIRRARDDAGYSRELVVGCWGLIPWFSKTFNIKYLTNNARSEELTSKASFKHPWA
ncbi:MULTISPECIES: SOS response-associated peptidase family protein [unclassified Polaromonas]|uniref:SOS response-associated peptidase family protein n=1 Tax=unclassified Polaromonas TaxID=2638319 RepID=UPI0025E9DDCE|nr:MULTISPECIES: SOS response-associated peptidase family protein [unclassified Polaromonas]HQS00630.1 SOS response-associated peptidase family protein [Polaromonas sp.]HQS89192.1 SOS response-associated peptidase family protein [Polaromonas sp.]